MRAGPNEVASQVDLETAIADAPTDGSETTITIADDFTIMNTVTIAAGKNIRFIDDGTARTITLGNAGSSIIPAFSIAAGATVTVSTSSSDNSLLTFAGQRGTSDKYTQFIRCAGTLVWENGTFENCYYYGASYQGLITVSGAQASMHLKDGLFQNNEGGYFSGLLTINAGADLTIDGGTITNNDISKMPSGASPVYISSYQSTKEAPTTFTMNGGIISNNKGATGGGIFIGCTPWEWAQKVSPVAKINSGVIDGNISTGPGGGVCVYMTGAFEMNGGTVSNNTAATMGGGVAVWDYWVGAYEGLDPAYGKDYEKWSKDHPAVFTMNGGTIKGNSAPNDPNKNASGTGGGVYAGSAAVTLNAGTISDNTAGKQGGGVYVPAVPYEIQINKALVTDNDASILGGGLWACPTGDVKVFVNNGGALYGNTATGAGNDVVSIVKEAGAGYQLSLADRILGGGSATWYDDGGILPAGQLGNPDPSAPRYPNTLPHNGTVTETETDLALHDQTTDEGMAAATALAALTITGNSAPRGGGIGTNGSVVIGTEDELKNVIVSKSWDDNDNEQKLRPGSVTVKLFRDGVHIDTATLNDANAWAYIFKNLPVHQDGNLAAESVYTIEEVEVDGYTSATESVEGETGLLFTITNTVIPPEVTSVGVTKVWNDDDDANNLRPESITVNLLRDGEKIDSTTLNADNGWSHVFEGLPVYQVGENEKKFIYTIEEVEVDGYTSATESVEGETGLLFTITNTVIPPEPPTPPTPVTPDDPTTPGVFREAIKGLVNTGDPLAAVLPFILAALGAAAAAGAVAYGMRRYRKDQ